jgi:uncharacterized protein YfbU (UPF0304 family)
MKMQNKTWHRGYKEVKNVIHNDIGITKEEILEIFRQIAKDEIQKIVSNNTEFIYQSIKEVIRNEMINAVNDHKYPKVRKNFWDYTSENSFKDFITDVIKEEIVNLLSEQFELDFNIRKK